MRYLKPAVGVALVGFAAYSISRKKPKSPPPAPVAIEAPKLLSKPLLDAAALEKVRLSALDSDPKVRWEAARFLDSTRDPQADDLLVSMLRRDIDPAIRKDVINLLVQRRDPKFTLPIINTLKDTEPDVRLAAIQALATLGDLSTASAISDSLHDTDEKVRLAAIQALATLQKLRDTQPAGSAGRSPEHPHQADPSR